MGSNNNVTSSNIEEKVINEMMDIENKEPIMLRLAKMNVDKKTLKDITSNSSFDADLYEHCRGAILLPSLSKILNAMAVKAQGGSIQASRTVLELLKLLNTKQDVNVNLLQYQGLSDDALDSRLESELRKHGIDVEDGTVLEAIDGSQSFESRTESEIAPEVGGDEGGERGEDS